ncbi:MAG: peroxide stress protein YaaA, partial [Eubacteriales bacterium]|nr:peroxide stress protein YaaA [Eubacteriales bacterium]
DATEDAVKDAAGDAAKGDAKHTADMETRVIVNLASKEYSKCIERFLAPKDRYITCVFGEKSGGKVIQKGTMAKMARGEMVRYMAENNVCIPEQMKEFDRLGYRFCEALSSPAEYVFIKEQT